MPYANNPVAETPPDDTKLWRYMDITKFLSLLETSTLYLAALRDLSDPLEGFITNATAKLILDAGIKTSDGRSMLAPLRAFRDYVFVSCWHASEYESAAMWKIYLKSDEGIAIRTSVGDFKRALAPTPNQVNICGVRYVDYDRDNPPSDNLLHLGLLKRRSFDYEREVRALVLEPGSRDPHLRVQIDIPALIQAVYVAPSCGAWFKDIVEKQLRRHGVDAPVHHSDLDAKPLY